MSKQLRDLLSKKDKKTAVSMIKRVLTEEGISKLKVDGFPPEADLTVTDLIDDTGWIGRFMLYSDELAIYLTGKRLWDCYYIKDHESIDSVKVIDANMITEKELNENEESIKSYTYESDTDINVAEKYIYIRNSIISSLVLMENGKVDLKEKSFLTSKQFLRTPNGKIVPLRNKEKITQGFLKSFFNEVTRKNENILTLNNNQFIKDVDQQSQGI